MIVTSEVRVRRAGPVDLDAIVALAGEALRWDPDEWDLALGDLELL